MTEHNTEIYTEVQENPTKTENCDSSDVGGILIAIALGVIIILLGFIDTIDRGGFYDPDRMY